MCWGDRGHYFCHDCRRVFNHFNGFTPCFKFENGISCGKLIPRQEVIQTGENCDVCKSARVAEEICQQKVHRQEPLVLFDRRQRSKAWHSTYKADLEVRKEAIRQKKAKEAAEKNRNDESRNSKLDNESQKQGEESNNVELDEESFFLAKPFITERHQFNT
ncbi:hypothetical protein F5X99DRAFT_432347 [Biscogniauxia marginata]|nr:hypothetical protein F5X99DRAFT_432347 [Biscogniauxia marginata]